MPAVAAIVALLWAAAASATAAKTEAARKSKGVYSQAAVTKAFHRAGLELYDAGAGQPVAVKMLASVHAHAGWRVGVYVYPDQKSAVASFKATSDAWRASGMAVARVKNVVITVVPNGHALTRKAKPWPMPALAARAIAQLERG